jgi:hypothetical protein
VNDPPPEALKGMTDRAASPSRRTRAPQGARSTRVTERDSEILAFVADHRLVLAGHVQTLLGVSETVAYRRLKALTSSGLLEYSRKLHGQPGCYQITGAGLAAVDSDLPRPKIDLRCYQHDIGVAWVWLAASRGAFGRVEHIVSEREMRSRDGAWAAARGRRLEVDIDPGPRSPLGVRLGGVGPGGRIRLHYPDLLLVGRRGERLAIELELSSKGSRRLETILAGYGAEPRIAAVLYLAEKPGIRREVLSTAARLGISDLVFVRRVAWPSGAEPAKGPARSRAAPTAIAAGRRPEPREAPAR